jgi:hypothetical protein
MKTTDKARINALIGTKFIEMSIEDKHEIALQLSKNHSERELERLTGIPRSTLNDWITLRQTRLSGAMHISLNTIYTKLSNLKPEQITDWGRIEMIKDKCEELLKARVEK